jgi:hypothetical protein
MYNTVVYIVKSFFPDAEDDDVGDLDTCHTIAAMDLAMNPVLAEESAYMMHNISLHTWKTSHWEGIFLVGLVVSWCGTFWGM